jgi:hypothetical protein
MTMYTIVILTPYETEWSASRPGRFTSGHILNTTLDEPHSRSGRCELKNLRHASKRIHISWSSSL